MLVLDNKQDRRFISKVTFENDDKIIICNSQEYELHGNIRYVKNAMFREKQTQFRIHVNDVLSSIAKRLYELSKDEKSLNELLSKFELDIEIRDYKPSDNK